VDLNGGTVAATRVGSLCDRLQFSNAVMLRVALCTCETWSVSLREEKKLRLFKNNVLRRIFGPKRGEVTGDWRKLRNKNLRNLHSPPDVISVMKSAVS
jgi:hypothetical protein